MDKEIKKMIRKIGLEMQFLPYYVYAQELGAKAPFRFYFSGGRKKSMKRMVRELRARGLKVCIWRPKNNE